MINYYSRIPEASVKWDIDGNPYARIPHRLVRDSGKYHISTDYDNPIMVQFGERSFSRNGEAYVWFARLGEALAPIENLPFAVTSITEGFES